VRRWQLRARNQIVCEIEILIGEHSLKNRVNNAPRYIRYGESWIGKQRMNPSLGKSQAQKNRLKWPVSSFP
jgi:hypothetical protein